jgi:Uma2 family endonuclease
MATQSATKRSGYTYEDYLKFPDDVRCEIINGDIYDMTPSPSSRHQMVSGEIYRLISNHLRKQNHVCRVFHAFLDVVLAEDQVVQPDVFVVCDSEVVKTWIFGVPDVIFEVASPSTSLKDRREKMQLYERFGVKEYFLVDPDAEFIEKYVLHDAKYNWRVGIYAGDDTFQIDTIGLQMTAREIFTL